FGVATTSPRDGFGSVGTSTDRNGNQTSRSHRWGVLENTITPKYTVTRDINSDGTVAHETRGGVRTTFGYDDLGRVTSISAPHADPTTTAYTDSSVVVSRGPTRATTVVDGFGRPITSSD